jgi:hypothetical protein
VIADPLGILNASITNARSASATAMAMRIDSRYSRTSLFLHDRRRTSTSASAFASRSKNELSSKGGLSIAARKASRSVLSWSRSLADSSRMMDFSW